MATEAIVQAEAAEPVAVPGPGTEQLTIYRALSHMRGLAANAQRDENACLKKVKKILKSDYQIAIECFSSVPRGGQMITTPSIRLAEILRHIWGHIVVHSWYAGVIDNGTAVKCGAVAYDAITSNLEVTEATRPIVTKDGRLFPEDLIRLTIAACQAIARRNAIFGVIPRSLVANRLKEELDAFLKKDPNRLRAECDRLLKALEAKGYSKHKILAQAGANKPNPDVNDLIMVVQLCNAINEGMIDADELKVNSNGTGNGKEALPEGRGTIAPAKAKAGPAQ